MKDKWKILYLGLDPTRFSHQGTLVHDPIIEIIPREIKIGSDFKKWTHILFTSQISVSLFFALKEKFLFPLQVHFIVVGSATKAKLQQFGDFNISVAQEECGEGVVALLETLDLKNGFVFYPHSSGSRPLLEEYLVKNGVPHESVVLYDTIARSPKTKSIAQFDEIVFTSPSQIDAFLQFFGSFPREKKLTTIGPVTQKRLDHFLKSEYSRNF